MKENVIQRAEKQPKQQGPNLTGIPTQMKMDFERRSGLSFDDVRVHYNSDKPARIGALAYTQGAQVYMGPGQESHLGHELGHVIQQKTRTIKATSYDRGVGINDDPSLEHDADRLSFASALSGGALKERVTEKEKSPPLFTGPYSLAHIIQCADIPPGPTPGQVTDSAPHPAGSRPHPQNPPHEQATDSAYRGMSGMNSTFSRRSIGFEQELTRFGLLKKDNKQLVGYVVYRSGGNETVVLWITTDSVVTKHVKKKDLNRYGNFYTTATQGTARSYSVKIYTIELVSNPFSFDDQAAEERLRNASMFVYHEIECVAFSKQKLHTLTEKTTEYEGTKYGLKICIPNHHILSTIHAGSDTADQITVGIKVEDILTDEGLGFLELPWYKPFKNLPYKTDESEANKRKNTAYCILRSFLDRLYDSVHDLVRAKMNYYAMLSSMTSLSPPKWSEYLKSSVFNCADLKNSFGVLPRSSIIKILDAFDEKAKLEIKDLVYRDFLGTKADTEKAIADVCFQYLDNGGSVSYHPNIDEAKIDGQDSLLFEYRIQDKFPAELAKKLPIKNKQ